jgi:hypothetical protein
MDVEKLERDGKVAVLISPGFGAGWSTWAGEHKEFALFDRRLVEAMETGGSAAVVAKVEEILGEDRYFYMGGAGDLEIVWLPKGERFFVDEYDGSESIVNGDDLILTA